jgi:hypothetical protein
MNLLCPDCSRPLSSGQTKCRCGWKASEEEQGIAGDNHQCKITINNKRCKLPGALSDSLRGGKESSFYCHFHFMVRDNPSMCATISDKIERGELFLEKRDWRDILIDEKLSARKA